MINLTGTDYNPADLTTPPAHRVHSLVDHANSQVLSALTKGGLSASTKWQAIEYANRGHRSQYRCINSKSDEMVVRDVLDRFASGPRSW